VDYDNLSQEQLISRIEELEILNRQLLNEKEQEIKLEYAWTHNLGAWYFNIKTNTVNFNPLKATALGYEKDEIPERVPYQFFTDKLHPEDYQKTMEAMLHHLQGKSSIYDVEYRILAKDGSYRWYYDRGKITQYDEEGNPLFLAGIVFNITERKEMELRLEQNNKTLTELASIDGLIKISNRRTIMNQLQFEIEDMDRKNKPLSIALFDLDDFKTINDNNGHVAGDETLVAVGELIKNNIRNTDLAGRYGGEEFLVVFPDTNLENAAVISERIRSAIENHAFSDGLKVTISGGVKQYVGDGVQTFIHAVDKKLYEAKNNGKNKIVY